ncbi:hypothetical protein Hanom_Chr02g00117441 [Helianthus anomalus]
MSVLKTTPTTNLNKKKRPETPGVMGSGAFSGVFFEFFLKKTPHYGQTKFFV